MRRIIVMITLVLILCKIWSLPLSATKYGEEYIAENLEQIENEIEAEIPAETKKLLAELNLTQLELHQILSLKPSQFVILFQTQLKENWQTPRRVLGYMIGTLLLCSLVFPMKDSMLKQGTAQLYGLISTVCLCSIFINPLLNCITGSINMLKNCTNFLRALIPILSAVLAIGGHAVTASGYQLLLFGACQLIGTMASGITSVLGVFTTLGIVTAIFPNLGLQGLINGLKRLLYWILGIVMTFFVAFLSMQSFVTSALDTVTLKTSRFVIGSFIPIVGSILSDAYGVATGCFSLLRSTIGIFGIIVALCMILPTLLKTALWYMVTWLGVQLSTILQINELNDLLKNTNSSISILLALQLSMLLLMTVAMALVIFIGKGG